MVSLINAEVPVVMIEKTTMSRPKTKRDDQKQNVFFHSLKLLLSLASETRRLLNTLGNAIYLEMK
jgi:hypothetical protein